MTRRNFLKSVVAQLENGRGKISELEQKIFFLERWNENLEKQLLVKNDKIKELEAKIKSMGEL